ncbi:hypothetical protein [Runella limosa]|uniref:hypothetical protein n=1 Tax=Runella limosa TaxID=370978 RepID=UPI000421EC2D|nr:hypothetical protein [Runella limosa]
MPATIIPRANQCLWKNNQAVGKLAAYDDLATVNLTTKFFDKPYATAQRNDAQRARIGYNTDASKRLTWLYEEAIKNIVIGTLGKSAPNGLHTLSNAELDQIASNIAGMSGEFIIADYEPHDNNYIPYDTVGDDWVWVSFQHPDKISYISQKVKQLTQSGNFFKKFLDWFQAKGFTFNAKSLGLMTNNGVWQNGTTVSVDDYIAYYANPNLASNFQDGSSIAKCGWGYSSITYKPDNAGGSTYASNVNFGPIPSYLSSLCGINRGLAKDSTKAVLYIIWPREDQERLNYQQSRYKPKALDNSTNPQGYVRMLDNRLTYPTNLIADNTFWAACVPNVARLHAWILPNSEDPQDILRYAKRNWNNACQSSVLGFDLVNYDGNDNPPCPSSGLDYYGDEAIGFNAIMQGLNRFGLHQDILDGTQTGTCPSFEFKRDGASNWTTVGAISDLSEFARSWKYKQPVLKVWTKPGNNKRVVLFQHPFAESYEPIQYRANIGGTSYEYTAEGLNTHAFRID